MIRSYRVFSAFSLIELLIVLVIIVGLATTVMVGYQRHVMKLDRLEAKAALWEAASKLEHFYYQHGSYRLKGNLPSWRQLELSGVSEHRHYELLLSGDDRHYLIAAYRSDFKDPNCQTLTLTDTNIQHPQICWYG